MNATTLAILAATASLLMTACATQQSNPFYQNTAEYAQAETVQSSRSVATTVPVAYRETTSSAYGSTTTYPAAQSYPASAQSPLYAQPVSTAQARAACEAREQNFKVGGAMLGGAVGAYAGKKLADDKQTLGMVGGAAIGGSLGYGAGDMLVDCDPVNVPLTQYQVDGAAQTVYEPASSPMVYPAPAETRQAVMVETGGQNAAEYGYDNNGYVTQTATIAPAPVYEQRVREIAPAPVSAAAIAPTGMTYIVQEDDTAWSLSRKTCSNIEQIKSLNGLEGDFLIKAGEAILLPPSQC